ncbi:hypothetical protein AB4Y44_13940 [Paraburkholderia sp. BR10937]|uniref:hypothetical protein n=1 Tax=Paraburkholderia sp. BR10937 TaxID=3236994 RepID=UPI0034D245AA
MLRFDLVRPDDLLNLRVTTENLRVDTTDPSKPALVIDQQGAPAWLVVTLPPQTIAENAFFESSPIAPEQISGRADPSGHDVLITPGQPANGATSVAQFARPSRLVFDVPPSTRIPLSIAGLTDWTALAPRLNPIAAVPPSPSQAQINAAPDIAEPGADQTALELPWRVWISPNADGRWTNRTGPFTARGRTELWHTRLVLAPADSGAAPQELSVTTPGMLRAIWSQDYSDPPPKPSDEGPYLARTAMAPNDRYQIVIETSAFHGWTVTTESTLVVGRWKIPIIRTGPFVPQPFAAEQLMLSPLGGWLRSRGAWTPPFRTTPIFRPPPNLGQIFGIAGQRAVAAPAAVLPRRLEPLDLSEWVHRASQGRDHYVRIVYEGELWPFRNKAALIKVTERQFRNTPDGAIGAYLIQHLFIVVREPVRTFDYTARQMPLKRVELTTLVTPDLADPAPTIIPGTSRSFWVEVSAGGGRERFSFHARATDAGGLDIDFTVPLMFASISDVEDASKMALVAAAYNDVSTIDSRSALVPGQRVAFAPPDPDPAKRTDNTTLVTDLLNFTADSAGGPPVLFKANVRIPQVQELIGADQPTVIALYDQYVQHGFDAATGVFAQIVQQDASGTITPATLGVNFSADKAGGIATPNIGVSTLTRALGPLAGQAADAATGSFNPSNFFPADGLARLFGAFDLGSLIPAGTLSGNAPQMKAATQDVPGGKLITTTIDFAPKLQKIDVGAASFTPNPGAALTIHGEIHKQLSLSGVAQPPTFSFDGRLTNFSVAILSSVTVNFTEFHFTTISGQKPNVSVSLDQADPIDFTGDLEFINDLKDAIPPGLFGDPPSLDISPTGITAGFAIGLPPLAVGVFALQSVALSAGLTLPFLDGKPVVDFAVSSRPHPFSLTVAFFAGGGFFHMQLDTAGMKALEAALEFGAAAAINLGVASGEVHVMAGIYFSLQRQDPNNALKATLTGYFRMGGSLSVLGLITVSVEFNLSFTYQDVGKAYGTATLTVEVDIAFFHKSVDLTVERTFGGSGGDPKFLDFFNTAQSWQDYAAAYA